MPRATRRVIQETQGALQELAGHKYERVVYLGSGPLQHLAREAALKLGELTNGTVTTCFDSPLGFRHGPKTFVNDRTLVVVFVSNDPLTRKYDHDLLDELRRDGRAARIIEVTTRPRRLHRRHLAGARHGGTRTTSSCSGRTSPSRRFTPSTNRVLSGSHPTTRTRKAP